MLSSIIKNLLLLLLLFGVFPQVTYADLHREPHLSTEYYRVYRYIKSKAGYSKAAKLTGLILREAQREHIPPMIISCLIWQESEFHQYSRSNVGACGYCQVIPCHFKSGVNPYNAVTNIRAGAHLLRWYKDRFHTWHRALTAYNFGGGAVVSRGIYRSRYSEAILSSYKHFMASGASVQP